MATSERNPTNPADEQPSKDPCQTDVKTSKYGTTVTMTFDGDDLRSLGINPDKAVAVIYRTWRGGILVEPVYE